MLSPTHDRQPLSEMPIWARLAFAEMIPKTHFGNENMTDPRHVAETEVIGFIRIEDTIWLYFVLDWGDEEDRRPNYIWIVDKDSTNSSERV